MGSARHLVQASLILIMVVSVFSVLALGSVSGAKGIIKSVGIQGGSSGIGKAGTGSVAVAAFFSSASSSGAGSFAGRVKPFFAQGNLFSMRGVFSLTQASSDLIPVLSCASGEVGAQGIVIAGNFTGQVVVVFGCVGTGVVVGLRIIDVSSSPFTITYDGQGVGDTVVSSSPILAGAVLAGNTDGSGSAGTGSIDVAEAVAVTSDGGLLGGGAFVGTLSGAGAVTRVAGVFVPSDALSFAVFIRLTCSALIPGVITGGSFLGQPVTTSVSLDTCLPTCPGPQTATGSFTIGTSSNIIYSSTRTHTMTQDCTISSR